MLFYSKKNMGKKITNEEFIEKVKKIHNNFYDYSKTVYVKAIEKVCIICPEHGEFWQTPHNHLHGQGCPKCNKKSTDKGSFVEQANIVHKNRFDY